MMFAEQRTSIVEVSPSRLGGKVRIGGAKNRMLRLLAASLLTSSTTVPSNYPDGVLDARADVGMLKALGERCVVDRSPITENCQPDSA